MVSATENRPGGYSVPVRYLLSRRERTRFRILTLPAPSGVEAVPIFGDTHAAQEFLRMGDFDGGWQVRATTAGELISLLLGQLADVTHVAPDPAAPDPELTGRQEFIDALVAGPLVVGAR